MWFFIFSGSTFTSANHLKRDKDTFEKNTYKPFKKNIMNILGNNANRLNDVIFENRHKNYGAYAIRSEYSDSLKKSILCLVSVVFLLFVSVKLYNKINTVSVLEQPSFFEDPSIKIVAYTTEVDMRPPVIEPIHNTAAAMAPAGTIPTQIVDVVTHTATAINTNNPINGLGKETATGISPTGSETSTISSIHIESAPAIAPTEIVVVAEEMPEFEGGVTGLMRYISQNIVYPPIAREIGKEGTVYVSFVVNETGNVECAKVMRGIGYGCDEEVIRVIGKMPRWKKAGKNAGQPVKVRFNIPVSFKLR